MIFPEIGSGGSPIIDAEFRKGVGGGSGHDVSFRCDRDGNKGIN